MSVGEIYKMRMPNGDGYRYMYICLCVHMCVHVCMHGVYLCVHTWWVYMHDVCIFLCMDVYACMMNVCIHMHM